MFKLTNHDLHAFKRREDHFKELPDDRPWFLGSVGMNCRKGCFMIPTIMTMSQTWRSIVDWKGRMPLKTDTSNRLSGSCMCQLKQRERKKKKDQQ
jgi:hypothetical protein